EDDPAGGDGDRGGHGGPGEVAPDQLAGGGVVGRDRSRGVGAEDDEVVVEDGAAALGVTVALGLPQGLAGEGVEREHGPAGELRVRGAQVDPAGGDGGRGDGDGLGALPPDVTGGDVEGG